MTIALRMATYTGIHPTDLATALLGKTRGRRRLYENLSSKIPQRDTGSAHIHFGDRGTGKETLTCEGPKKPIIADTPITWRREQRC